MCEAFEAMREILDSGLRPIRVFSGRLQFVRLTMRSTARRAFSATVGSTVTS